MAKELFAMRNWKIFRGGILIKRQRIDLLQAVIIVGCDPPILHVIKLVADIQNAPCIGNVIPVNSRGLGIQDPFQRKFLSAVVHDNCPVLKISFLIVVHQISVQGYVFIGWIDHDRFMAAERVGTAPGVHRFANITYLTEDPPLKFHKRMVKSKTGKPSRFPVLLFAVPYSLISSSDLPMVSLPNSATTSATTANTPVRSAKTYPYPVFSP